MSNGTNNSKKTTTILGVVLALFVILSIALFVTKQSTEARLTEEKELVIKDLNNLKSDYDQLSSENASLSQELSNAKDEIAQYVDSIAGLNADVASLTKFRSRYYVLRKQKEELLAKVAELEAANAKLTQERDATLETLQQQTEANEELLANNLKLAEAVKRGAALNLTTYSVSAVKERSNGSYKSTRKASSADALQVCFTVAENAIANTGGRSFYIEVIDATGTVINAQSASNSEGASINYTSMTQFNYENMSIDVCDYVKSSAFEKGNYMVNTYDENLRLLGTASITLK
jgi:cell division protein FtsB